MTTVLIITGRRGMLIMITFKLTIFKKTNVLRGVTLANIIVPYSLTEEKVHS